MPGAEIATEHGALWVEQRTYPGEHRHGSYPLAALAKLSAEAPALLGTPELGAHPAFLDTETTGLSGGAGTLAFLIGVGVWRDDHLALHLIFMRDPAEEPAALRYLAEILATATGLVTFNGLGFDVPILESRFVLNRLSPGWMALPHLDLLPVARQLWRDHLPSRRLIALEEEILAVARAETDLPSWMIPGLYRQYLRTGDAREMARIFYHNRVDVLSFVTLLAHTGRMLTARTRWRWPPPSGPGWGGCTIAPSGRMTPSPRGSTRSPTSVNGRVGAGGRCAPLAGDGPALQAPRGVVAGARYLAAVDRLAAGRRGAVGRTREVSRMDDARLAGGLSCDPRGPAPCAERHPQGQRRRRKPWPSCTIAASALEQKIEAAEAEEE